MPTSDLPSHYAQALRTLVRFACAMLLAGLLAGVLFQESSKKIAPGALEDGLQLQATLPLALLHGHVLVSGALIPLACAGALLLARRAGGRELRQATLFWLTRGYLPFLCTSLCLMLYKGYHVLLAVRGGELDLAAIDERFFFGRTMLRHEVYGVAHVGMALSLGVFAVALWRSLGARARGV
jgi:hypothetical protein